MPDQFTTTSSTSWFSRVGSAFGGVIFGLILILGSIGALSWNEGRAIKTIKGLKEGARLVVEAPIRPIDAASDQTLVHVSGPVVVTTPLTDEAFGVTATGVRLVRNVEMYQWQETSTSETRTKLGGGEETVTTYSYSKDWSGGGNDSSAFAQQAGHENPPFDIEGATVTAQDATLGDFRLSENVIDGIGGATTLPITPAQRESIIMAVGDDRPVRISQNHIYLGQPGAPVQVQVPTPTPVPAPVANDTATAGGPVAAPAAPVSQSALTPQVGDVRIAFELTPAAVISVVARQSGDGFLPYRATNGEEMLLVDDGNVPAADMFAGAQTTNQIITWLIRVAGIVAMMTGFSMLFAPLGVLGDVLPLFGTIIRMGTGLVGFVLAMVIGSITIALSWMVFRPLVGIGILVVGALIAYLVFRFGHRKAKVQEVASV
ncbi:TMEM43 family protein [Brevundimonas sp.]|uniref:TMEM43 family protein n=1 Tax=Brevundimonas sp. TaxID=1871086 RepID=UPI002489B9A3|nr:TMEM43 family protein [Brevundimonas sp.]MDI1282494.1 TMEM43 family protein [Brevundimonas sp.]